MMNERIDAGAPARRVVEFFEALSPASLDRLGEVYREDATFKDPFHAVRGADAIERIFRHMFKTTREPRFTVLDVLDRDGRCFLTWNFHFRGTDRGQTAWVIHGATRIAFDQDGRIREHRDYWDAAEQFYEKLPLVGAILRLIRRQLRESPSIATMGSRQQAPDSG